jgi:phospholipase C
MKPIARVLVSLTLVWLTGCGGSQSGGPPSVGAPVPTPTPNALPIQHVVIVVQENRSFDNLFAGYPNSDSRLTGYTHTGKKVALKPIDFWPPAGLDHSWHAGVRDWNNGAMNGFDTEHIAPQLPPLYQYSYLRHSEIAPYWAMAQQYVLADHMFPTEFGPSFTAHQNLIAGSTEIRKDHAVINLPMLDGIVEPGDCTAPAGTTTDLVTLDRVVEHHAGPRPCYDYPTIADSLDDARVSWKYYEGFWPGGASTWDAFGAIRRVRYGRDWDRDVTKVPLQILTDAAKGKLPSVAWVIPTAQDSDHPGTGSDRGPSWVAQVVNAIGTGPQWKATAIIVLWDDWGGWYDEANPPQLDYRGLAVRVPCIIISPYAKAGAVVHTRYEFGSILKTIERIFNVASINTTDVRATDMLDAFDFTQAPRPFKRISAKYARSDFLNEQPAALRIPDPGDE